MIHYVTSYLVVGMLVGASLYLHNLAVPKKRILALLFAILLWPLLLVAAPQDLFGIRQRIQTDQDDLKRLLQDSVDSQAESSLSTEELQRISAAGRGGYAAVTYFYPESGLAALREYWNRDIPPAAQDAVTHARYALRDDTAEDFSDICYSLAAPDWYVGLSNEFLKSVKSIDGKVRGKVLDAIGKIGLDPITPHGDTVKPLSGSMYGLWRYRIGDYRLVYFPDRSKKQVTLICFGPRASVYEQAPTAESARASLSG